MMVRTLGRKLSMTRSFHLKRMFENSPSRHNQSGGEAGSPRTQAVERALGHKLMHEAAPVSRFGKGKKLSDVELMKERFARLLLGEDMTGGAKGVSSALALSNAITNLAASNFGERMKLKPISREKKTRWQTEMDWYLSVTDNIVEFVPSKQPTQDGGFTEIMVTKQRADLHMNIPALRKLDAMLIEILEKFKNQEFQYFFTDTEECKNVEKDDKGWLLTVQVPKTGLSEVSRRWLHYQQDSVTQVLKAAMAINSLVLSEMEIPESYIDGLPKNGKTSLGDSIYKSITEECFDAEQFLSTLDLSTENKVLDLKNRIEASIVIWKRKMHPKDGKPSWGSIVSLEKRELFEERAETLLILLKQQYPGIPQSTLDTSKIQNNQDVGKAILESYSRALEGLAFTIMSRIEDVLYADSQAQRQAVRESDERTKTATEAAHSSKLGANTIRLAPPESQTSKTLQEFMGWSVDADMKKPTSTGDDVESYIKGQHNKATLKSPKHVITKKFSYLEKLETISGLRSPTDRH